MLTDPHITEFLQSRFSTLREPDDAENRDRIALESRLSMPNGHRAIGLRLTFNDAKSTKRSPSQFCLELNENWRCNAYWLDV
jgi:hypothetical protein